MKEDKIEYRREKNESVIAFSGYKARWYYSHVKAADVSCHHVRLW